MYERVYDMLNCEIEKIENKGELNSASLENLGKLVDIIKDLQTIEAMGEYQDDGYSNGPMRRYYNDGMSSGKYYRGRGYSYDDGGRGEMIRHLEAAMHQAKSESERNEIRQMIDRMK